MRVKIFEERPNIEIENEINHWLRGNKHITIHHVAQSTGMDMTTEYGGRSYLVISIFYDSR